MRAFKATLWAATIALFLSSCGGSDKQKKKDQGKPEDTKLKEPADNESKKNASAGSATKRDYILPSTLQVASILKRSGLDYKEGLVNDPTNVEGYVTAFSKKVNFGVYSADLAYLILNGEQERAMKQMKAVRKLADDLGLGSIFNMNQLTQRFEKNLNDQDTLVTLLIEIQENYDRYVQENGEGSLKAITYAGGWIESMYFGSRVHEDNAKIAKRLVEQMTILENIIASLRDKTRDKEQVSELVASLESLHETYEGFFPEENDENDPWSRDLSKEQLKTLEEKIGSIRNNIVNP